MKILFILVLFFIFGFKQQLTYCQVVCNGWIDSDLQVITTPCGENIGNPCQTIDQAVETCGNYDTINLYFAQTTKPFIISENGSFNSINNKTITLNNINNNNQPILIDLSTTTKPFINITPNENNNSNLTNTISINGFTFSNQNIQSSSSSIIKMVNSNLNMNINNCNFLNNTLGQNGLFYFSSDPNVKNSNVGLISIVNSNFINNVGNDYSIIYSDYDSHIIIDNCLFKNISSNKEGAVLDLEKGFTTITNSLFQSILLNNKSGANVIFLGTPQPSNDNYLITIDNITISDSFTGYGIVITSLYYTININNSKFIDNYNFLSIGVFNSIISDININNCIFQDNSNLNSNSLAKGGAISLINSPANISNSIFNLNSGNLGGAIYIGNGKLLSNPIVIIGCTFIDCKGTVDDGDSIFINGSTLVEITNSTFTQSTQQKSNQPKNSQVYCQSTSLLLSSLKFINQSNSDELLTCFNNSNCKIIEKSDKQYYNSCNPPNGKNDSDDSSNNNNEHNHRRLSPLQIFGIVVGSIIVVIIIFLIVVLIYIKVKRNRHYIPIK